MPNRVVLADAVKRGDKFQIAIFGINGPISVAPENFVWFRAAKVEFSASAPNASSIMRVNSLCCRKADSRWLRWSENRQRRANFAVLHRADGGVCASFTL